MSGFGTSAFGTAAFSGSGEAPAVVSVVADGIGFVGSWYGTAAALLRDGILLSPMLETTTVQVLIERLRLTGSPFEFATKYEGINDGVAFEETLAVVWRMLAAEGIDLAGSAVASQHKLAAVIDVIHASGLVASRRQAMVEVATVLALNGMIAGGWKVEASNSVAFQEALVGTLNAIGKIVEGAGFGETASPALRLTAIANEGVQLGEDAAAAMQMLATASEEVLFYTTLRLGDGEDFVGWVLNGAAASEYRNFPFNGLVDFDGRYFGTTRDGLFELVGDDDDGEDIDAHIKSALVDFGTSALKQLPDVYVAMTHGNQVVLKVVTTGKRGEQVEHIYTQTLTQASALHNGRIKLGRGLESKYWQFELANVDGADFDFDELVFRPVIIDRRI